MHAVLLTAASAGCPAGQVAGRDSPGCETPKFLSPVGPGGPGAGAGLPQTLHLAAEKTAAKRHRQSGWKSQATAATALQERKHTVQLFFPSPLLHVAEPCIRESPALKRRLESE